ncbi:MAG: hypothetical protein ACTSPF_06335 [Candidatus Heimdallarchaeaceae archaeon]
MSSLFCLNLDFQGIKYTEIQIQKKSKYQNLYSPIPFVLPLSLFILLAHRAWRDDRRCRKKYGKLWEEYCLIAKYKMIPKIY